MMMNKEHKKIIAFAGRKRCGKTTLAKYLKEEENAVIITIADFLKHLCCKLMNMSYEDLIINKDNNYTFDIIPDERWFKIIDNETHIGVDNIKKELHDKHITSIRQLLQVIGTDVIRKYDEDWHVNKMIEEINSYSDDKLIVIDDVRFPNEKNAILNLGGDVFFIIRSNSLSVSNHPSETALKWQDFEDDKVIINNYSNVDAFLLNFKVHYVNHFDIFIPKSILLSENEDYKNCSKFGYENIKDCENLLYRILQQIKTDKLFWDFGLIKFKTCDRNLAEKYIKYVDTNVKNLDYYCNIFITNNPLIVENLKVYL